MTTTKIELTMKNYVHAAVGFFTALMLTPVSADGQLSVRIVDGPPDGATVRVSQTQRDETGPTSFRYYAPRTGPPTKTNTLALDPDKMRPDHLINDQREASYYYRDRDLGQTITIDGPTFRIGALTVRLQPVDVAGGGDPGGAAVSVQWFHVTGTPRINDNGTAAGSPASEHAGVTWTNPRWATYAYTWPFDPNDAALPDRRPLRHLTDDYITGEHYESIHVATGGTIPEGLSTNDYLRFEFRGEDQIELESGERYAFLILFDEPALPGVQRNVPLSNINILPGSGGQDPYPAGHMIRRDGRSTYFYDVFITDIDDPADVAASRRSASFPRDQAKRLAIPPGTIGYPDVDTYRDLYFYLESTAPVGQPSGAATEF